MSTVVIGPPDRLPAMRRFLSDEGEVLEFPDTEPIKALHGILETRPTLVVLEQHFAATPRGIALVDRIRNDGTLAHCQVRVMSHGGGYTTDTAHSLSAPADPARPLDWRGTRRALRTRVRAGIEIQLDGKPCAVVDLSAIGVQVVSTTIIKPNQKVRVSVPNGDVVMRFRGTVVWAKFELPQPSSPPLYRAGVEFIDADNAMLTEFCARNRQ